MKLLASTVAGLATALVVAGLAAACGGSGDNQTTPQAANFADCLRQQGIDLPTARAGGFPTARPSGFPTARPSGFPTARPSNRATARPSGAAPNQGFGNFQRPDGVDEQTWQKALQACASLRPSGFPGGGRGFNGSRGPGNGNGNSGLTAYLNCLSEHGVTYSPGQTLPDAAKVCEVLRPSGTGTP